MNENLTINGGSLDASLEGVLAVVEFLKTNYQFRFNVLNGKVEFLNLKSGSTEWRDLTDPAINSIILKSHGAALNWPLSMSFNFMLFYVL